MTRLTAVLAAAVALALTGVLAGCGSVGSGLWRRWCLFRILMATAGGGSRE